MSRVGNQPIIISKEITVEIKNGRVLVSGPKGKLFLTLRPEITAELKDGILIISRKQNNQLGRSLHGVTRTLIVNMIKGVTEGFSKTLKILGVGYRAKLEGQNLELNLGFSHPVVIKPPSGIEYLVEGSNTIKIEGIDKIQVGREAAEIRAIRPPEPYKGKGIRYLNEEVRKKAGKTVKAGAAGTGEK